MLNKNCIVIMYSFYVRRGTMPRWKYIVAAERWLGGLLGVDWCTYGTSCMLIISSFESWFIMKLINCTQWFCVCVFFLRNLTRYVLLIVDSRYNFDNFQTTEKQDLDDLWASSVYILNTRDYVDNFLLISPLRLH